MNKKKYLVTGVKSGLGKHLFENLQDVDGLHRNNFDELSFKEYSVIIHCAFNKSNKIKNDTCEYYKYLNDNIFLTQKLLNLNYDKFIYISSIDVYDKTTLYSLFKRLAESLVIRYRNSLIIRCPVLLGKEMKPNHLTKMFSGEDISLSGKSTFNYILYENILNFLRYNEEKIGIWDFISRDSIALNDIKKRFGLNTHFGNYIYGTPNNLANPLYTSNTSLETVENFYEQFFGK